LQVFHETNITFMEITMNTGGSPDLIRKTRSLAGNTIRIGAGTVLNGKDLDDALSAGAGFIVSPSVTEEVIRRCVSDGIPVIPGALTPTEIQRSWDMGAAMVKLFPASVFGPAYIKAVKGPLNDVKIMAVGGVGKDNAAGFIQQGADAIGFGGSIIQNKWLTEKRYDLIKQEITDLVSVFRAVSGSGY
jgi:2-dehydro-3-deoxyphosphogluconate aldolase/(4S)-4-hydroxy-2-oxoglutarate aldolase